MKKYFLLVVVAFLSVLNKTSAQKLTISQDSLFWAPDTICINQPITLIADSNAFGASSYYWGFCSGYLMNAPTGDNLGNNFGFAMPENIDIMFDQGNYYGFVVNSATTEFIRLNFGNSLTNTPTITNFGDLTKGLPVNPTSLYIVKDTLSLKWHIFVTGGFNSATSTIGRIDFGTSLANPRPNIVNFGNYFSMLDYPKGIFVAQDANNEWFGYVVNRTTNNLIRLDFSFNVSNTPKLFDYGNVMANISSPSDMAAVFEKDMWYLFITNDGASNTVTRIDLGNTLFPDPIDIASVRIRSDPSIFPPDPSPYTFNYRIDQPSSISINRDCGDLYAYITDRTTHQLIGIQMASATGPYNAVDYNNVGAMNLPTGISSVLRNQDDLYAFVVNSGDSTLTRLNFSKCTRTTIPSFTEIQPPAYHYDTSGVFNVYFVINQGRPDMRVDCKAITVLPYPPIAMNQDTLICEGDTVTLYAISTLADSFRWQTGYAIDTNYLYRDSARVWPDYTHTYPVTIHYPFGCIVDTSITVHVSKVRADAGPDRWARDGATSTLGGPYTTLNGQYQYKWEPFEFMSDSTVPNPYVYPPYDYTYYLTVTELNDTLGCQAKDTVVVHMDCGDFYLPNAFAPNSISSVVKRFGVLNKSVIKLNYLRIYDRWGNQVFETTDPTKGWDGTFNGQASPMGVYVWEADGFCLSGKRINKHGNVSLLR